MRPLKLFLLLTFVFVALKPTQAARDIICEVLDNTSETLNPRFRDEIKFGYVSEALSNASDFVLETFNQSNCGGRGYSTVLMIVESFIANGYYPTIATNDSKQFRVNADYLQAYVSDVKAEFTGIVYHESARVWQWTGNDTAPIGLITSIADYIQLRARWPSKYWPLRGSGSKWDFGYTVTTYFLEFCNRLMPGFVSDLNAMMENSYSDAFFMILLGQSVDELWKEYIMFHNETDVLEPAIAPEHGALNLISQVTMRQQTTIIMSRGWFSFFLIYKYTIQ